MAKNRKCAEQNCSRTRLDKNWAFLWPTDDADGN